MDILWGSPLLVCDNSKKVLDKLWRQFWVSFDSLNQ